MISTLRTREFSRLSPCSALARSLSFFPLCVCVVLKMESTIGTGTTEQRNRSVGVLPKLPPPPHLAFVEDGATRVVLLVEISEMGKHRNRLTKYWLMENQSRQRSGCRDPNVVVIRLVWMVS